MSAQGTREFFSATSNVPFRTEQELHEHYRSAFHRYNLKRRVAGLGPVTREWFDTHRDKLSLGRSRQGDGVDGNQDCIATVYYDPLSKKQFNTEAKYNEFVNSNKYKVSITTTRTHFCLEAFCSLAHLWKKKETLETPTPPQMMD